MARVTRDIDRAEVSRLTSQEWRSRASAVIRSQLPWLLYRRPTVSGVAAYFDLVTDDTRLFFGDSFHVGYFRTGHEALGEAHDALTDLVAAHARVSAGSSVLDLGCGIGAPAIRIARAVDCRITGVNASREQVRQGRVLVDQMGLSDRIDLRYGNALALDLPDESFDAVICLEAAGNICVAPDAQPRLLSEIWRVLKPGGHVGFCDFVFAHPPARREGRALRAFFYCTGREAFVDWPAHFRDRGFTVAECDDLHAATLPTWARVLEAYSLRSADLEGRYGKLIASHAIRQVLEMVPAIVRCGAYPAFSARKPGRHAAEERAS
jgi:O-methyltransferase StaMB